MGRTVAVSVRPARRAGRRCCPPVGHGPSRLEQAWLALWKVGEFVSMPYWLSDCCPPPLLPSGKLVHAVRTHALGELELRCLGRRRRPPLGAVAGRRLISLTRAGRSLVSGRVRVDAASADGLRLAGARGRRSWSLRANACIGRTSELAGSHCSTRPTSPTPRDAAVVVVVGSELGDPPLHAARAIGQADQERPQKRAPADQRPSRSGGLGPTW